jgi:hypothetical protein
LLDFRVEVSPDNSLLTGIGKEGRTYQLINLSLSDKRIPRIKLSDLDWQHVLERYQHRCPVCSRSEPEVRFQQDHKIPRTRGGSNELIGNLFVMSVITSKVHLAVGVS